MRKKPWIPAAASAAVVIVGACAGLEAVAPVQASPTLTKTATITATNTPAVTETPRPSDTPLPSNSPTPAPPTPTATPSHPIQVIDDFGTNSGIWYGCERCEIVGGMLHLGKYPAEGADMPHVAYCETCGQPINYRMAVDTSYQEGVNQPGRGYGFVVKLTDEYLMLLEISTYQDVIFWKCDQYDCEFLDGKFSGYVDVIPAGAMNRIEVEFKDTGHATADIYCRINGHNVLVLWNQPADPGYVGLELYGHSLEIAYDNFEFEEYTPYGAD
jgi:hypothetical protein